MRGSRRRQINRHAQLQQQSRMPAATQPQARSMRACPPSMRLHRSCLCALHMCAFGCRWRVWMRQKRRRHGRRTAKAKKVGAQAVGCMRSACKRECRWHMHRNLMIPLTHILCPCARRHHHRQSLRGERKGPFQLIRSIEAAIAVQSQLTISGSNSVEHLQL